MPKHESFDAHEEEYCYKEYERVIQEVDYEDIENALSDLPLNMQTEPEEYKKRLKEILETHEATICWPKEYVQYRYFTVLDKHIGKASDVVLKEWLNRIDYTDLFYDQFVLSPKTYGRILSMMSEEKAIKVLEEGDYWGPCRDYEIEEAAFRGYRLFMDILIKNDLRSSSEERAEKDALLDSETATESHKIIYDEPQIIIDPQILKYVERYKKIILSMGERLLQQMLREVDHELLVYAIPGFDEETRFTIFRNMSGKSAKHIINQIYNSEPVTEMEAFEKMTKLFKNAIQIMKNNNIPWVGYGFAMI